MSCHAEGYQTFLHNSQSLDMSISPANKTIKSLKPLWYKTPTNCSVRLELNPTSCWAASTDTPVRRCAPSTSTSSQSLPGELKDQASFRTSWNQWDSFHWLHWALAPASTRILTIISGFAKCLIWACCSRVPTAGLSRHSRTSTLDFTLSIQSNSTNFHGISLLWALLRAEFLTHAYASWVTFAPPCPDEPPRHTHTHFAL